MRWKCDEMNMKCLNHNFMIDVMIFCYHHSLGALLLGADHPIQLLSYHRNVMLQKTARYSRTFHKPEHRAKG